MSKYKVGDKVVMKIISADQDEIKKYSVSGVDNNWRWCLPQNLLERYTEPLSTYTEPLEAKIRRQAAEITRLLAENKELKEESKRNYTINIEMAKAEGHSEAWELARNIILPPSKGGMSSDDYMAIFGSCISEAYVMKNYTYQEAAAKVAEWEKAKEEVKVGDVLEDIYVSKVKCVVTNLYPDNMAYSIFGDGTAGMHELNNFKKTGRHIDIDGFLKQIGEEEE